MSSSGFPAGTSITNDTCSGTLNPGDSCDITITPGSGASTDMNANACTTAPGTEPVPTIVTVSADNAPSVNINVLILGYGCIYQGGFLFTVDDNTPDTGSIGGKVTALADEPGGLFYDWAIIDNITGASSIMDGFANSNILANPPGQYPAAQICLNKNDQGYTDWYLPAICEIGRYIGIGIDAGCGNNTPNIYSSLFVNNLGGFFGRYWSSTEFSLSPAEFAWYQLLSDGGQNGGTKDFTSRVRCIRAFAP